MEIKNTEELSDLVNLIQKGIKIDLLDIDLLFLDTVTIKIKGDPNKYNGSINYAICNGICEFQNEIWRAYAKIKTGVPNIKKLSQEEKESLEMVFRIDEGCTEIIADLKGLFIEARKCFEGLTNGMNGNQKILTYVGLALCIGGVVVFNNYIDADKQIELSKLEVEKTQNISQIESQKLEKVLTTIRDVAFSSNNHSFQQSIQAVESYTKKGYREMTRAVSDAENITIKSDKNILITLDKAKIENIVSQLSNQDKPINKPEVLDLYIDGVKRQDGKIIAFVHSINNEAFTANLDSDMLGEDGINQVIDRVKDFNTIKLEGMVKRRAGKIEYASFSSIIMDED